MRGGVIFIAFLRLEFKSLDNVRMSSNNAPEKWATKFMNNTNMGNIIPLKSRNTALNNLNVRMPASWEPPPPSSFPPSFPMESLRPMGTRSGLGMLPNLKTPLYTPTMRLTANAPEWVPSASVPKKRPSLPQPPPNSLNLAELIPYMKDNGRIYKKGYTPEAWRELNKLISNVRDEHDIHLFFRDGKNGPLVENPFFYIRHKTPREKRVPLQNMTPFIVGTNRTYRVRPNKRKQTRRRR